MIRHNTTQNKSNKYIGSFDIEYEAETPKLFSMRKTVLFGMLSILTILMLNVPIWVESTYAYGIEGSSVSDEVSLVRNHFVTGSPVHPNLVIDNDLSRSEALEERTNQRNHFSYGQAGISDGVPLVDNVHEKRRD
ncbi:hypothetical protein [Nitrosopumilus sp.]|uniref:hypothetical protein n=1 Tax=Nitrosopumilus sp. TaxID=2024843 RepID=UPI00247D80D1|nr:hypothetical protein [Nitrosopumilus sp.]MCV0409931.1 hypothetical protein [Nitrosopumilus sp.]